MTHTTPAIRCSARCKRRRAADTREWFGSNTAAPPGEVSGEHHWQMSQESLDEEGLHYRVRVHRRFVRRAEHARALNEQGLRVSGTHEFHANLRATNDASELPQFDFGIVACKATQTREAVTPVAHLFKSGAILSSQNGLG